MNDFFENLLNPPAKIETGQIWRSALVNEDLVVTDTTMLERSGIIRAALVSPVCNLNDGNDLQIDSGVYGFLPSERIILRLTDGPVERTGLTNYCGRLNKEDIKKLISSLKNKNTNDYHEGQLLVISRLLVQLEVLRHNALSAYESGLSHTPVIIPLTAIVHNETTQSTLYQNILAAADHHNLRRLQEFWDKEWENQDNAINILDNRDIKVRLSVIDSVLYFVAFSPVMESVSDISLKKDELIIRPETDVLSFGTEQRVFAPLITDKADPGSWMLSFTAGERFFEIPVVVE